MEMLRKRIERAVESVLENEGLISDLEKDAASVLQDWGIQNVRRIAESTGELDDENAEEAMYPKMKASRALMRAIRVWISSEAAASAEERAALWEKLEKRAQDFYGAELHLPPAADFSAATSAVFIKNLLAWFETYSEGKQSGDEKKSFFQSLFGR